VELVAPFLNCLSDRSSHASTFVSQKGKQTHGGAAKLRRNVHKGDIGAEISGHVFVGGSIYVLRGTEQNAESWTIARLDPREEMPDVKDIAVVPFACRSLTFDGELFWTNYRAKDMIISFVLPNCNGKRAPAPNA
jgi:hypothetical protein